MPRQLGWYYSDARPLSGHESRTMCAEYMQILPSSEALCTVRLWCRAEETNALRTIGARQLSPRNGSTAMFERSNMTF